MSEQQSPLKVFLCHASADKPKVRELYRFLKRRGIQPWLDAEDLLPGQDWRVEISKALSESDAIIIFLSKESVDKEGYVQKEIKFALDRALEMPEGRIFIIPARLEECDVPRSISGYHWVDLFNEDGNEKLMKSLKVRATQLERASVKTTKLDKTITKDNEQSESVPSEQKVAWAAPIVHHLDLNDSVITNANIDPYRLSKQLQEQAKSKEANSTVVSENKNESHQISLEEMRKELLEQKEIAIQYERLGKKREALKIYEYLKRSDILLYIKDIDIDTKILALKLELNSTGKESPRKLKPEYIVAIIGAIATLLAALIGILPQIFNPVPVPTATPSATMPIVQSSTTIYTSIPSTKTLKPTSTPKPNSSPTKVMTRTPTSLPTEIKVGDTTMRLVPAGEFMMGSDNGNLDEKPIHAVYLESFYMDKYEVTISQYKTCVSDGGCNLPEEYFNFYNYSNYWMKYPVVNITWYDAVAYCVWRGARLPTEAEWEKSARGTDQRTYPWGNDEPKSTYRDVNSGITSLGNNYANFGGGEISEIERYEKGISPYGIYHLAGNVWEWVADRYSRDYYYVSDYKNPLGPTDGIMRVLRGGSYHDKDSFILRSTYRYKLEPSQFKVTIGFRCARDAQP